MIFFPLLFIYLNYLFLKANCKPHLTLILSRKKNQIIEIYKNMRVAKSTQKNVGHVETSEKVAAEKKYLIRSEAWSKFLKK